MDQAADDHDHDRDDQVRDGLHRQAAGHDRPGGRRCDAQPLEHALLAVSRDSQRVADQRRRQQPVGDRQPDHELRPAEFVGRLVPTGAYENEDGQHHADDERAAVLEEHEEVRAQQGAEHKAKWWSGGGALLCRAGC